MSTSGGNRAGVLRTTNLQKPKGTTGRNSFPPLVLRCSSGLCRGCLGPVSEYVVARPERALTARRIISKPLATREDLWLRTPGWGPPAGPKSEMAPIHPSDSRSRNFKGSEPSSVTTPTVLPSMTQVGAAPAVIDQRTQETRPTQRKFANSRRTADRAVHCSRRHPFRRSEA